MRRLASLLLPLLAACPGNLLPPTGGNDDMVVASDLSHAEGCAADPECGGATPRCDRNSGRCVPCLPLNDNCPKGQKCVAGDDSYMCTSSCASDRDCPVPDGGAPARCCGGGCVDTSSDAHNCGACGSACPAPQNAEPSCIRGQCGLGPCNPGFGNCDGSAFTGCETDIAGDPKNCGACRNACTAGPNQSAGCSGGACKIACLAGFADCNLKRFDGCEIDTRADTKNCGACAMVCGALPNAVVECNAGACVLGSCDPGHESCNMQMQDGCEIAVTSDVNNCGACGKVCNPPHGAASCNAGNCRIDRCDPGFSDCNGVSLDGCESMSASDPDNCGACGHNCVGGNSKEECQMGACRVVSCFPGFGDCNKRPEDGCEDATTSDPLNCGACGMACPLPANATASCANSTCGVGQCFFGFADCNQDPKDGCETNLLSLQSCGACKNVCVAPPNATAGCNAGMCGIGACNALWGDCDKNPGNGCEKGLANDLSNCGKCGSVCAPPNAMPACLNGQCGFLQCNQGFGDCDKNPANGCELSLTNDASNCGQCGMKCPMNAPFCIDSACAASSYATVTLGAPDGGNKALVFVFAPAATAFATDADYAAWCTKFGFTQNQNWDSHNEFLQAKMSNQVSYYCNGYCCYLGSGNAQATRFTNGTFKNFGLLLNTPLQVLDRGCGWYGGSFATGMNTTDALTVTSDTTYTYNADALGPANYSQAKGVLFSQAGVIVCQAN